MKREREYVCVWVWAVRERVEVGWIGRKIKED